MTLTSLDISAMGESLETLGEFVARVRKSRGITQAALAKAIGVDGQTISNLETGQTKTLKMKFLEPLSKAIGAPVEQIVELARDEPIGRALRLTGPEFAAINSMLADYMTARGITAEELVEEVKKKFAVGNAERGGGGKPRR